MKALRFHSLLLFNNGLIEKTRPLKPFCLLFFQEVFVNRFT